MQSPFLDSCRQACSHNTPFLFAGAFCFLSVSSWWCLSRSARALSFCPRHRGASRVGITRDTSLQLTPRVTVANALEVFPLPSPAFTLAWVPNHSWCSLWYYKLDVIFRFTRYEMSVRIHTCENLWRQCWCCSAGGPRRQNWFFSVSCFSKEGLLLWLWQAFCELL